MSAPLLSLHRCCQQSALLFVARRRWSSSSASPSSLSSKLLRVLTQHFYDVEMLLNWRSLLSRYRLRRKNVYYSYTQRLYGPNVACAYYILCLGGGFRYAGQSHWFRANRRGKFAWDFLNYKDSLLEEIDMSHTDISYTGVLNLENQLSLRTLKLQGCPEVDDWFLTRLHPFQESLEELDISHCPRITMGGLPSLRNLKGLKRLNISYLPGILNPGLVIILLEELLPQCHITADGYNLNLKEAGEEAMDGLR